MKLKKYQMWIGGWNLDRILDNGIWIEFGYVNMAKAYNT